MPRSLPSRVAHRVHRVAREIQHHLLQLHRVGVHRRQSLSEPEGDTDAFGVRIRLDEVQHVDDRPIHVYRLGADLLLANELAQVLEHAAARSACSSIFLQTSINVCIPGCSRSKIRFAACA